MARIIVIDDDAETRAICEETLRSGGHEVALAASGEEGIKHYRNKPTDLVLMDLFMPDKDGLETMAELRKDYPGVRILAISGHPTADSVLRMARHLGAVQVVEKPFQPDDLLAAVDKALRAP